MKSMTRASPLMLAMLLLSEGPALGQGASSALKGHNSNAPVDVAA